MSCAVCLLVLDLGPARVRAQLPTPPTYVAIDGPGALRDLNDLGQVVGRKLTHGFLFDPAMEPNTVDLGVLEPYAINNNGLVVGSWNDPEDSGGFEHGFVIVPEDTNGDGVPDLWYRDDDEDGVNDLLRDIGRQLFIGLAHNIHPPTQPVDVNDDGVLVGFSDAYTQDGSPKRRHAFVLVPEDTDSDGQPDRWLRDDNEDGINDLMSELPPLGTLTDAMPFRINSSASVVGASWNSLDGFAYVDGRAVLWDGTGVLNLGILYPGVDSPQSYAAAINGDEYVVGGCSTSDPLLYHALIWSAADGLTDLGKLASAAAQESSGAVDINESGWVVGGHDYAPDPPLLTRGFLLIPLDTDEDGEPDTWYYNSQGLTPATGGANELMFDLDSLVPGATVGGATRINANGQILASGYLLTPCSTSICPDLSGDGQVNITDYAIVLAAYGSSDEGDVDCDGDTDITDLAIVQAHYGQTCE